jgi:hypothetical protein
MSGKRVLGAGGTSQHPAPSTCFPLIIQSVMLNFTSFALSAIFSSESL